MQQGEVVGQLCGAFDSHCVVTPVDESGEGREEGEEEVPDGCESHRLRVGFHDEGLHLNPHGLVAILQIKSARHVNCELFTQVARLCSSRKFKAKI